MDLNKRIDILDYLRGFALMGIILVNVGPLLEIRQPASDSTDFLYWKFLYLFVEGRFYTIFTFLFGIGFYIFITRANARGKNAYVLFLRRIAVLFLIGLVHVKFHPGEALTVYAISGLIILPFYKANKVMNLIFGGIMLFFLALFSIKIFMVVPLMLLGVAAGQYRIFENIPLKKTAVFTVMMFLLGVVGISYQAYYAPTQFGMKSEAISLQTERFFSIGIAIGPLVSAFYAGLLVLLLRFSFFQKLLSPLKSYGRLALTNYLCQTVFILLLGNRFHLFGNITYLQSFKLCLAIYIIQLIFSCVWLRYFRFGPIEWLWRMITYREIPPMRQ